MLRKAGEDAPVMAAISKTELRGGAPITTGEMAGDSIAAMTRGSASRPLEPRPVHKQGNSGGGCC
jgi:hypothetical protein